jgi:hypothetical protein
MMGFAESSSLRAKRLPRLPLPCETTLCRPPPPVCPQPVHLRQSTRIVPHNTLHEFLSRIPSDFRPRRHAAFRVSAGTSAPFAKVQKPAALRSQFLRHRKAKKREELNSKQGQPSKVTRFAIFEELVHAFFVQPPFLLAGAPSRKRCAGRRCALQNWFVSHDVRRIGSSYCTPRKSSQHPSAEVSQCPQSTPRRPRQLAVCLGTTSA